MIPGLPQIDSTLRTINELPLVTSLLFLLGALVVLFAGVTWWSHRERMATINNHGTRIGSLEANIGGQVTALKSEIETTRSEWATRDMAALQSQAQFGLIQQELTRAVTGLTTLIDGLLDKFNQREAADKARDEGAERTKLRLIEIADGIPDRTAQGVKAAIDDALRREFDALKSVITSKIEDDKTHRTQVVDTILKRLSELRADVTKMKETTHETAMVLPTSNRDFGTWNGTGGSAGGTASDPADNPDSSGILGN